MRKLIVLTVFFALMVACVVPAFAQDPTDHGYGSQPGYSVSASHTVCQGHGAFGAFGAKGDVVHDFGVNNPGSNGVPGANGQATGDNNSNLCGNPQSANHNP